MGALYGLLRFVSVQFESAHDRALLGDWVEYGFFQTKNGPHFYKERVTIKRHPITPWRLIAESKPISAGKSTVYRGTVISRPPYLYCRSFDPIYHDRTFEILHRKMDVKLHNADTFVGIHLGKTYEDTIHTACAVLMTRIELDPNASTTQPANPEVEKSRFLEIVSPYFKVDRATYQLLLT